jgi:hypothetical protein
MKMLTNCPLGKKDSHSCWWCLFGGINQSPPTNKICTHPNYKETMKVKPRKVTHGFCVDCGTSVKFRLDWEGVASLTRKGVIHYKELFAYCPHCDNRVYVPAVNDVNVYRRNKAYEEKIPEQISMPIASGNVAKTIEKMMQMQPSEETERGKEILNEMFTDGDSIK